MTETSEITSPLIKMLNETGGLALRMNSGTIRVGKSYIHMHEEGTWDILFFPRVKGYGGCELPVWIECKTLNGKTKKSRAEAQARFCNKIQALGHRAVLATSVQKGFDEATKF